VPRQRSPIFAGIQYVMRAHGATRIAFLRLRRVVPLPPMFTSFSVVARPHESALARVYSAVCAYAKSSATAL